MVCSCSTVQLR